MISKRQNNFSLHNVGLWLVLLAVLVALVALPMESMTALLTAIATYALGLTAITVLAAPSEKRALLWIFTLAFVVRLSFAMFLYQTGLIDSVGGKDDLAWKAHFYVAQQWQAASPPSLWEAVYAPGARRNNAFNYFSTLFYYVLDVRSQMALACLNCFAGALIVVMVYLMSREAFSYEASVFVALCATFLLSFLVWSALTIKENWVILLETFIIYASLRCRHSRNVLYLVPILASLILLYGFRYYMAAFSVMGVIMTLICYRSPRPWRRAVAGLLFVSVALFLFRSFDILRFDPASLAFARIEEMATFRDNVSQVGRRGNTTAVELNYDIRTPAGGVMSVLVGSVYLLLSPFPWQLISLRQILSLPDVVVWWVLFFGFVLPGVRYLWRHKPDMLIALSGFLVPLIIFFSLIFGNIGLAYRQRTQLIPFFLVLAAAGYEARQKGRKTKKILSFGDKNRADSYFYGRVGEAAVPARFEQI